MTIGFDHIQIDEIIVKVIRWKQLRSEKAELSFHRGILKINERLKTLILQYKGISLLYSFTVLIC